MRTHKHTGVIKSHSIKQKHKDIKAQQSHNFELKEHERKHFWQGKPGIIREKIVRDPNTMISGKLKPADTSKFAPIVKDEKDKQLYVMSPIDKDNYVNIDLDSCKQKGVRIMFTRKTRNVKKTVALQIEKDQ